MNVQTGNSVAGLAGILGAAFLTAALLGGCATAPQANGESAPDGTELRAENATQRKSGGKLWSERCARCHYARDAGTFSQEQWEIIMMHMRVRANLTAYEHEAILEFFQPAK